MLPDYGPGDFVVALSCGLHRMPCHVIESYHVGENAHCLVEGTEPEEIDTKESEKKELTVDQVKKQGTYDF